MHKPLHGNARLRMRLFSNAGVKANGRTPGFIYEDAKLRSSEDISSYSKKGEVRMRVVVNEDIKRKVTM